MNPTNKSFKILSVNSSENLNSTKVPVQKIDLIKIGIVGDSNSGSGKKQINILSNEIIEKLSRKNKKAFSFGELGEHITTINLNMQNTKIFDQIYFTTETGEVVLEVTTVNENFSATLNLEPEDRGICCRVINGGSLRANNLGILQKRELSFGIITFDSNNPNPALLSEEINKFSSQYSWKTRIEELNLTFNQTDMIDKIINTSQTNDIVLTIGKIGIGSNDLLPEVFDKIDKIKNLNILHPIKNKIFMSDPDFIFQRADIYRLNSTILITLPSKSSQLNLLFKELTSILESIIFFIRS